MPVVDWTDAPADLNELVRFAEGRNFFCACAITFQTQYTTTVASHLLWFEAGLLAVYLQTYRNYDNYALSDPALRADSWTAITRAREFSTVCVCVGR